MGIFMTTQVFIFKTEFSLKAAIYIKHRKPKNLNLKTKEKGSCLLGKILPPSLAPFLSYILILCYCSIPASLSPPMAKMLLPVQRDE